MTAPITDLSKAHDTLREALENARDCMVLTGAGLSTQSGIPDFRSPGGIWERMQPVTFQEFERSEEARLEDWRRRVLMADLFRKAEPNAAHTAIAQLAADGPVELVVTQNIDGLHRRAGLAPDRLIEIHGTGDYALCLACDTRHEIAACEAAIEATGNAPRCTVCGGLVKAAVISFGQAMPMREMAAAEEAALSCDLFIAAGTSLVVYPVAGLSLLAKAAGAQLIILSQLPTEQDGEADAVIRTPLAETFAPWVHQI